MTQEAELAIEEIEVSVEAIAQRLREHGSVFAEDEAVLLLEEASDTAELGRWIERRCAGEPIEHLVGWAEFAGRRILIGEGVFVPRHRTELLVRIAAVLAGEAGARPVIVDLCTGSGAIAAVLLDELPGAVVHASDLDARAVRWASANLAHAASVWHGDLFDALPSILRGACDVVVANVPYVPTAALRHLPVDAREHEPELALDGGADGLEIARRVLAVAPEWLAPGGSVLFEASERQVTALCAAAVDAGLEPRVFRGDDAAVVTARRPARG